MAARRLLLLALALTALVAGTAPAAVASDADPPPAPSGPAVELPTVSVLVANVGNVSRHCRSAANKLCVVAVEDRVTASIAALDPDVVALTEVLPPHWCDRVLTLSPFHTCARSQDTPQAARLLAHDDYDIVCTDRFEWNCLAVRSSVGSIDGCDGGYCGAIVPAMPVIDGCAKGFENFLVDVELHGESLTVGVAHLNASDVDCRATELSALLDAVPDDGEVLLAGDFNLDPWRMEDRAVDVWHANVGDDRRFAHRSGIAEHDPPYRTVGPPDAGHADPTGLFPAFDPSPQAIGRTLDHLVATEGLPGTCTTLGAAPDTRRIDGSEGGLDHLALDCEIVLTGSAERPARTVERAPQTDVDVTDPDGTTVEDEAAGPPAASPLAPVTDLLDEVVAEIEPVLEPVLEPVAEVVEPVLEPLLEPRVVAPPMQHVGAPVGSPLSAGLLGFATALLFAALSASLGSLRPTGRRR